MRTHKDAKAMARSLREALAHRNVPLAHGECLEIVARQLGFADWNTLSAKLPAEEARLGRSQSPDIAQPTAAPACTLSPVTERVPVIPLRDVVTYREMDGACEATRNVAPEPLSCSFCGKSQHDVRSLIEGGCSRPRRAPENCFFICDECVTFCAQINADTNFFTSAPAPPP
jgi:hypothetical protein